MLTAALVVSPWLVRNYAVFGKFVFVRDNLPLEMHMANNDQSTGLWTRSEHPGNDPEAMRSFRNWAKFAFMEEKRKEFQQFVRRIPASSSGSRWSARYFWIGTPQATSSPDTT